MKNLLAFVWLLFSSFPTWAQDEEPKYPDNQGAVNDFAGVLSTDTKDAIRSMAANLRDTKGPCVVVVTTPSLYGLNVEDYTNNLFKKWKIGHKNNDGLIFLIAPNERKMRIEIGYGLEPVIPDLIAKSILSEVVKPWLAKDKWDAGILAGTQLIIQKLGGAVEGGGGNPAEESPAPSSPTHQDPWYLTWWGLIIVATILMILIILAVNDDSGFTGVIIGAILSSGSRSGGSGSGGGGGGGRSKESSSKGDGDSGGGGASDSF